MLVFVVLCWLFPLLDGYPDGAPELGCYTSRPMHENFMPQWENAPYKLTFHPPLKNLTYSKGKPVKLRLRSLKPDQYKLRGYLIIVTSSGGLTLGDWKPQSGDSKAIPECGVTQKNVKNNRTEVAFTYIPPNDVNMETIQFRAIAVHNLSVFWDSILSPPLVPQADDSASTFDKMFQEFKKYAAMFDIPSLANLDKPSATPGPLPPLVPSFNIS